MAKHYCDKHFQFDCQKCENKTRSVAITTDGNLAVDLGSNLAIDVATGELGIQIAPGVVVDF